MGDIIKLREVPFEDLKLGDQILVSDGTPRKITEIYGNGDFVIACEDGTGEILLNYFDLNMEVMYKGEKQ